MNINVMIHFAREEEKNESKSKSRPLTFTVVEQQSSSGWIWTPLVLTAPPLGQPFFVGEGCSFLLKQKNHSIKCSHSWTENLLTWNRLTLSNETVHSFLLVYGRNDTSKGLGLSLSCAWVFISHAWAFLETGSEINSFRNALKVWGRESRLGKLHLSDPTFQGRQSPLNSLTEVLMTHAAVPGLASPALFPPPPNSLQSRTVTGNVVRAGFMDEIKQYV